LSLFSGKRGEAEADRAAPAAAAAAAAAQPAPIHRPAPIQGGIQVANIGKSISIRGDLTGNEDMVIEGKVEGKVDLPNNQLTIGADGSLKAEIHAKSVVVVGHVVGNVVGIERVEIQGTGMIEGDVTAPKLIVAEGARLNGAIQMSQASGASKTGAQPAPAPGSEVRKAG
jgi:cytoskeletal protein CcmA (bactofilin family)